MTSADLDLGADLDLLDDPFRHARCRFCQLGPPGVPFTAMCGRRAVGLRGINVELKDIPPGVQVCPECLEMIDEPCRLCGRS